MTKLRVLSSAMGGNVAISEFLRPIATKLGMEFVTMSEWPQHDILWKRETWLSEIEKADIVVCVARYEEQPAKSANRATQAMSLGKPVLASPLPAYLDLIRDRQNGFICKKEADWERALEILASDPELRKRMGQEAKRSAQPFSIDAVGAQWVEFLKNRAQKNCDPPAVDIIIPTLDNLPYLKPCIEAIRKATDWPHRIVVVASGSKPETLDWIKAQPDVQLVHSPVRLHFSAANNAGLKASSSPYVCLLNDDTIVGKGWLNALMHEAMKPGVGAVGPFSNCDRGWLHDEMIVVEGHSLVPDMKVEVLEPILAKIQDYRHKKVVVERKWVAFYCTLIPRAAIEKVGMLDEGFLSGDEDVDYSKRLREAGYRVLQTWDSWVFHFGGKTRKQSDAADPERHRREDEANHAYFRKKWGAYPGDGQFRNEFIPAPGVRGVSGMAGSGEGELRPGDCIVRPVTPAQPPRLPTQDGRKRLLFYTGEAWERWTPKSIEEGGIGGSETATVYTALDFLRKGWQVTVVGDCEGKEGDYGGVEYVHHTRLGEMLQAGSYDLFVSSRRADVFSREIPAKKKLCVVHDIWLSPDRNANLWPDRVDAYLVLSPWHKQFFLNHHQNAPPDKVRISRDGIDLKRFAQTVRRDPGRIVYSSSPDRGLDTLLHCLPEIRKQVPHANVQIFYGFENWEKAVQVRKNKEEIRWMEEIKAKLEDPGVVMRGRVGQAQLAREMLRAQVWAHPTRFTETFCITAAEQMAAGNPVVTTDLGALSTTVGDAGILIPGDAYDKAYQERFVSEVVRLMTDAAYRQSYHERSLAKAKKWSWEGIADEWLSLVGLPV
jgi:GT2 family glycosyltransferase/glycosyltransferase involved in cell wall biosynthesis